MLLRGSHSYRLCETPDVALVRARSTNTTIEVSDRIANDVRHKSAQYHAKEDKSSQTKKEIRARKSNSLIECITSSFPMVLVSAILKQHRGEHGK